MIVAISGSRTFLDRDLVERVVERLLDRGDHLHIGDAPAGVDLFAGEFLFRTNPKHDRWTQFFAHWGELGRGAGHERNHRMIERAAALVAIFADGTPTPGTSDALAQAFKHRIPAFVFHEGVWRPEIVRSRKADPRSLLAEDDRLPETFFNPPPPPNGKP